MPLLIRAGLIVDGVGTFNVIRSNLVYFRVGSSRLTLSRSAYLAEVSLSVARLTELVEGWTFPGLVRSSAVVTVSNLLLLLLGSLLLVLVNMSLWLLSSLLLAWRMSLSR